MQNGISVYLGLDNTFEENIDLIHTAASYGIQRVFTSFHIPETNLTTFKSQAGSLFNAAKSKNMEIITDISPENADTSWHGKIQSFRDAVSWHHNHTP